MPIRILRRDSLYFGTISLMVCQPERAVQSFSRAPSRFHASICRITSRTRSSCRAGAVRSLNRTWLRT